MATVSCKDKDISRKLPRNFKVSKASKVTSMASEAGAVTSSHRFPDMAVCSIRLTIAGHGAETLDGREELPIIHNNVQ